MFIEILQGATIIKEQIRSIGTLVWLQWICQTQLRTHFTGFTLPSLCHQLKWYKAFHSKICLHFGRAWVTWKSNAQRILDLSSSCWRIPDTTGFVVLKKDKRTRFKFFNYYWMSIKLFDELVSFYKSFPTMTRARTQVV